MSEETILVTPSMVPSVNQETIARELRAVALEREQLETAMIEALEKKRMGDITDHLKQ